jgi:hypothetical protein
MSTIIPEGTPLELCGKTWKLVWTLAVIDRVQEHFDESIGEVILRFADARQLPSVVAYILSELINDDIDRRGLDEPKLTEGDVKWMVDSKSLGTVTGAILASYGISMPKEDEEDPKNGTRSLRS